MYFVENETTSVDEMWKKIENIRKIDLAHEQSSVERHWKKYVKDHINIELKEEVMTITKNLIKYIKEAYYYFHFLQIKKLEELQQQ